MLDFEGGGRGSFEMADRDPEECKVGMEVVTQELTAQAGHISIIES